MQKFQFTIEVPDDYPIHEVGNDIQRLVTEEYCGDAKVVDQRVVVD